MHQLYNVMIQPFVEFQFMRYALASVVFLALSAGPVGVFLVMRRMSLMGDAMSHAVLPGAAAGYIIAGMSLPAMSIGGFIAGLIMALVASLASRFSTLKEDANFAAFYLCSLSFGVVLVSKYGSNIDLLDLLFGSILAVDKPSLTLVALSASLTLLIMAIIYRPLTIESIDPTFLRTVGAKGSLWYIMFQILVVINLVSGFQALGTIMSVGLMMLPAICARLWCTRMGAIFSTSVLIAITCGYGGLLFSYYVNIPSGPAIILLCGVVYLFSLIFAIHGGILPRYHRSKHRRIRSSLL